MEQQHNAQAMGTQWEQITQESLRRRLRRCAGGQLEERGTGGCKQRNGTKDKDTKLNTRHEKQKNIKKIKQEVTREETLNSPAKT